MPESPLVQKETVALAELEALIAARAKGESETELGFRKRIEREEAEYRAAAKHLGDKYKVDNAAMEADYSRARDQVVQTFQRDTQATKAEYEQTKKQIDEQLKKDTRRAKKSKEETGWQALAMFEGQRDEGIKWRRGTDAAWNEEIAFLHQKQDERGICSETMRPAGERAAGSACPRRRVAAAASDAAAPRPKVQHRRPAGCGRGRRGPSAEAAEAARRADAARQLQGLRASIEEHLIALDGAQASQVSQDRQLHLAVAALGRRCRGGSWVWALRSGWTTAGIVGGVVAVGLGSRGLPGLELDGSPERGQAQRTACEARSGRRRTARRAREGLDQEQIRHQDQGAREEARVDGARRRGALWRAASTEFQSRHQKQTEEADKTYPARLEQIRVRRDEGLKKAEEHFPPRIAALKEKYEKDRSELDESYRKTKETTKVHYDQAWANLIKNWTEGMARVEQHRERGSRRVASADSWNGAGPSSTAGSRRSKCRPACASARSTSI